MKAIWLYTLLALISFTCSCQNILSIGAKMEYGTSAFPMDATIMSGGTMSFAKSGATLTHGIIARYMIGDKIGIESGVSLNHYSFYLKDDFTKREIFWKSAAEFEILNVQMPIILNYKMGLPRHPFRYIMVSTGTSLDQLIPFVHDGVAYPIHPGAFQNIVALLKVGREGPRGNRFEIGIETQYSLKEFLIAHLTYNGSENHVYSRLNMVALNLSYFFVSKNL